MAKFVTLFSGSSGNSYYIGSSGQGVLIDAGRSCKQIESAMLSNNLDMRSVRAIFITHEHTDHCQGLRVLASRYGINVYASEGTMKALEEGGRLDSRFTADIITSKLSVGDMLIERFDTPHDSAESCAFRVTAPDGKRSMVATDMGVMLPSIRNAIAGCDLAVVESNHDVNMLMSGPYPYPLKRRILSEYGHLSNIACAEELPDFVKSGVKRLVLGHLSGENNTPDVAYMTALCSLKEAGMVLDEDFTLEVAPRQTNGKAVIF
ncbi:MAG: MBL fold metallo-hydrolase [Eubacteriales bacterium]|nr:MBL fold metallo-hydrolase [Eubacteriales bacterium]